jgi:hypothetical protein
MFKKIFVAAGAVLIGGYMTWSLLGWEFTSSKREPVPTVRPVRSSSSHGRTGYYGHRGRSRSSFGGFGFGK